MLSLNAAYQIGEHGKDKTEVEHLVESFDRIFTILEETTEKDNQSGFVWEYYVPYFTELKDKGHVDAFVDHILQNNTVAKERINSFLKWSEDYKWEDIDR